MRTPRSTRVEPRRPRTCASGSSSARRPSGHGPSARPLPARGPGIRKAAGRTATTSRRPRNKIRSQTEPGEAMEETDLQELHRELESQGDEMESRRDDLKEETDTARQAIRTKVGDQ